jgi:hypothetical protein
MHMNAFIEERVRLVRLLADKADPFTKVRLLKLAERYDEQLGLGSKTARPRKNTDRPATDKHQRK